MHSLCILLSFSFTLQQIANDTQLHLHGVKTETVHTFLKYENIF